MMWTMHVSCPSAETNANLLSRERPAIHNVGAARIRTTNTAFNRGSDDKRTTALYSLPLPLHDRAAHHGWPKILLCQLCRWFGLRAPGCAALGIRPPLRCDVRPIPPGRHGEHSIRDGCRAAGAVIRITLVDPKVYRARRHKNRQSFELVGYSPARGFGAYPRTGARPAGRRLGDCDVPARVLQPRRRPSPFPLAGRLGTIGSCQPTLATK